MWLVKRDRDEMARQPWSGDWWNFGWPMMQHFFEQDSVVWSPRVDVEETENAVLLHADMPGIDKSNLKVQLENNTLIIRGERKYEKEDKSDKHFRSERAFGTFQRTFSLSDRIKAAEIKADYKDGVLTVTLPKAEEVKPKEIEIK